MPREKKETKQGGKGGQNVGFVPHNLLVSQIRHENERDPRRKDLQHFTSCNGYAHVLYSLFLFVWADGTKTSRKEGEGKKSKDPRWKSKDPRWKSKGPRWKSNQVGFERGGGEEEKEGGEEGRGKKSHKASRGGKEKQSWSNKDPERKGRKGKEKRIHFFISFPFFVLISNYRN